MKKKTKITVINHINGTEKEIEVEKDTTVDDILEMLQLVDNMVGPLSLRQGRTLIRNGRCNLSGEYEVCIDPQGGADIVDVDIEKVWDDAYCGMEAKEFRYKNEAEMWEHQLYLKTPVPIPPEVHEAILKREPRVAYRLLTHEPTEVTVPNETIIELCGFDYRKYRELKNPLDIDKKLLKKHKKLLKRCASVRSSMVISLRYTIPPLFFHTSVLDSLRTSVLDSLVNVLWNSFGTNVLDSAFNSMRTRLRTRLSTRLGISLRDSVWDSMYCQVGAMFPGIDEWKYTEKVRYKGYPFQAWVDLWNDGYIPLYLDGKWHLWKNNGGIVYTLEN
jgi:hypothetical protein